MTTSSLIAPLLALIAPFLIWPLELLLPLPFLVEELVKAAVIYIGWPSAPVRTKLLFAALTGLLFGFSESVLYLVNFLGWGNMAQYFLRLAVALPLHAFTSIIILLPGLKYRHLVILGLPPAILIHYLYNRCLQGSL